MDTSLDYIYFISIYPFINMDVLAWETHLLVVLGYSLTVSTISFRVDTGKSDITIS